MLKKLSPFHFDVSASEPNIPAHVHRSMQYSIWEGGLTGIMSVFTGGVVLTGFALALGANAFVIGLIAAIQVGANLLQVRAFRSLERKGNRKAMTIKFAAASRVVWLLICGLALISFEPFAAYRIWLLLMLIAVASGLGIFSLVPWISWLVDMVPQKVRGRFFAQRNLAAGAVGVVLGVAAGKFIDWWNAHAIGPETHGFVVLIAGGIVFGLWAVATINKMHDPPFAKPASQLTFWQSLKIPFRDANFRRVFYFRIIYDLSMGIAGTFYGVYLLKQAGLSFTFVSAMAMLATLTNLLALKPWGKFLDKFGNKPILYICMAGKTVFALLWIFTTPHTFWLYIVIHLFGIFDAGNAIAIPNLIYKISPAERRANYIAVDGTVVGIAATIAPLIGGGLALVFAGWNLTLGNFHWAHFHFLFFLAALLRLGTFWALRYIREPEAKSVAHIISVIRPVRSIDIFEGFQQALHSLFAPAKYVIDKLVERPRKNARTPRPRRRDKGIIS